MSKLSKIYLLSVSFISGMSIMAIEITSARLLAPHYGTSSFIWTNVIGIVMIALSIGYYLGGKIADHKPRLSYLLKLILFAGGLFMIIPWIIKPIADFITDSLIGVNVTMIIFLGSLLVTFFVFAWPIILLGMVSPFIIRLYNEYETKVGTAAGTIFAVSTVGSIIGTFLPTLFMIPLLGSRMTVSIFAIVLIFISLLGLLKNKFISLLILLLLVPLTYLSAGTIKSNDKIIYETESAYQYISIEKDSNGYYALVFNEGLGTQSVYHPDKILTGGKYYDSWNLLPNLLIGDNNKKFLIIGLAGGTIARSLNYFYPNVLIDGVEIDDKVIATSKKYFDLDIPNLTIFNQDGRIFLDHSDQLYDFIVVDAYSNELYIPWTMTTIEFWLSTKRHLTENGLVAININSSEPNSEILLNIANTVAQIYPYVWIYPLTDNGNWNYIITASRNDLEFAHLASKTIQPELYSLAQEMTSQGYQYILKDNISVMTDDLAPIQFLTDKMILEYIIAH